MYSRSLKIHSEKWKGQDAQKKSQCTVKPSWYTLMGLIKFETIVV